MGLVPAGFFCRFSVAHNCGAGAACVRAHASSNVVPGKENAHTAAPSASAIATVALGATHNARSRALGILRGRTRRPGGWSGARKCTICQLWLSSNPWRYAIE